MLIVEYPNIAFRFLALELRVSYGSAHAIVNEQLGRSKGCARRIPHQLTTEQEKQRVTICRNWFREFEPNGRKSFSDVVTGDECWISFYTIKDKRFKVSVKENEVPTEKNSSRASIFATKASYISN